MNAARLSAIIIAMRLAWMLACGAACGRLHFDERGDAGAAGDGVDALTPAAPWLHHLSGVGFDNGRAMAVGADDAVYEVGTADGTIDFGSGSMMASADAYLAAYNFDGSVRYARVLASTAFTQGNGIAIEADGTAIVVGMEMGTADVGGGPHPSAGGYDAFVGAFSPNGAYSWGHFLGGAGDDLARTVTRDAQGNVYVAGQFNGTVDFGGGPLTSAGGADVFVVSYTAAGAFRWAKRFGTTTDEDALQIVAGSDRAWVIGNFRGTLDIGSPPPTAVGSQDFYVVAFGFDGGVLAAHDFGSTGFDVGNGLAVLANGDIAIAATAGGVIDFGGGPLDPGPPAGATVLARVGVDFTHRWSQIFPAAALDLPGPIAADASDNIYVPGVTNAAIDLGSGVLPYAAGEDFYLARFTGAGAVTYAVCFGSSGDDEALAIGASSRGNIIATGVYGAAIAFGGLGTVANGGGVDAYLIQLAP